MQTDSYAMPVRYYSIVAGQTLFLLVDHKWQSTKENPMKYESKITRNPKVWEESRQNTSAYF